MNAIEKVEDSYAHALPSLEKIYKADNVISLFQILVKLAYNDIIFPDLCQPYLKFKVLQTSFNDLTNSLSKEVKEQLTTQNSDLTAENSSFNNIKDQAQMINDMAKNLNLFSYYNKKYGEYASQTPTSDVDSNPPSNWMEDYLKTTCEKLDVYKCVSNYNNINVATSSEESSAPTVFAKRLIDIDDTTSQSDRFIFLPYISILFSYNADQQNTKYQFYKPIIEFLNKSKDIIVSELLKPKDFSITDSLKKMARNLV